MIRLVVAGLALSFLASCEESGKSEKKTENVCKTYTDQANCVANALCNWEVKDSKCGQKGD